jgi:hypothetical protein
LAAAGETQAAVRHSPTRTKGRMIYLPASALSDLLVTEAGRGS